MSLLLKQISPVPVERDHISEELRGEAKRLNCVCQPCRDIYYESNMCYPRRSPINFTWPPADSDSCRKDQIHNVISKECQNINSLPPSYISGLACLALVWLLLLIVILTVKFRKIRTTTTNTRTNPKSTAVDHNMNPNSDVDTFVDTPLDSTKKKELTDEEKAFMDNNSQVGTRFLMQANKLIKLTNGTKSDTYSKHMPWFGIDIGGSLVKVVFFDPVCATREEAVTLNRIRRYLKSSRAYGTTGKRDAHLEMPNCIINKRLGCLHFIRFATSQMQEFLMMAKNKHFADIISHVCATGGGACKFEQNIKTDLGITLQKSDELDSMIHGIHYVDKFNPLRECYFLSNPLDDKRCLKEPYDFSQPYPYLVVNIGSGVSILAVYSSTSYSRISGSSIGGGTFLGLCCLLTGCKTFDEAIRLAKTGTSAKVDKLVKDIYGGDYMKLNLTGDTVASSFGNMMHGRSKDVTKNDLARALLEMVTLNIGSLAGVWAASQNIDRVVFIGNFLRFNQLSMRLLSYAVDYWSKGTMKALFLEHEGYFGAVGCFVESYEGNIDDANQHQ